MKRYYPPIFYFLISALICTCHVQEGDMLSKPLVGMKQHFRSVGARHSNITFTNKIEESVHFNYFIYPFIYFGGGVSTGDINNDGLPDIYMTGNMSLNALYLNKGGLQFEDITQTAGVAGVWNRWTTGTTMADVNSDGYLDIYVCAAGPKEERGNLLYINRGDNTFEESGEAYGVADQGHSMQAAFFDYDRDGDLDLYLANYPPSGFANTTSFFANRTAHPNLKESDKLYRNDNGRFVDVTIQAGILNYGLSLGVSVADYNQDHWPDIYVSNDFNSGDYLYLNRQDGTFENVITTFTDHTSNFGMGIDAGDINGDGLIDLLQLDMMASNNEQQKANMSAMNPDQFSELVESGLHHQYMKNVLQVNNGVGGFSDVSEMAGVAYTDWSWGGLFMDMNNNGRKDIFVTNGMRRNVNDNDFNAFMRIQKSYKDFEPAQYFALLDKMPVYPVSNFAFHNKGDLIFETVTGDYGLADKGFSNGAAYADFDLDGDLDLVVNNLDTLSSIFENVADAGSHYLRIKLENAGLNKFAIGSEAFVYTSGECQHSNLQLTRGYQSSVEPIMHFGLGEHGHVDSVKIIWPDGGVQQLENVKADQLLTVSRDSQTRLVYDHGSKGRPLLRMSAPDISPGFLHEENEFDDFKREVLLPHKMSRMGPALAVGDVNGDRLDDFYIGGAMGSAGGLYIQKSEGSFVSSQGGFWERYRKHEDVSATFFDGDGDGHLDLYVVSGGNEKPVGDSFYNDRLYTNNGQGKFSDASDRLPNRKISGSTVHPYDYDRDGDIDLFIGGRQIPGKYPQSPGSYLLRNDSYPSSGCIFTDVTQAVAPGLSGLGMVTDAVWADLNNDTWPDLTIVGEWMAPTVFINNDGVLENGMNNYNLDNQTGWWYTIEAADIDKDGDIDLIAGNLGLNYKYKGSPERPFTMFSGDLDENGSSDIVLGYYETDVLYPLRGRECSSQQIPSIKKKFPNYTLFSRASLSDVYPPQLLESATRYAANNFRSMVFINAGDTLIPKPLPNLAQVSSIEAILIDDIDGDGHLDLIVGGNEYDSETETPRSDASIGLLMTGDGLGNFTPVAPLESGIKIKGEVKNIELIRTDGQLTYIVAINDGPVRLISTNQ